MPHSKYTYCYGLEASYARGQLNFQGNNSKSLHLSIESSLKRLKTDYIGASIDRRAAADGVDIFYLHFWDYTTSIPEVMNALDTLIRTRKVLYLGISDTPGTSWPQTPISYPDVNEAWIVAKANEYARHKGLTPFSV